MNLSVGINSDKDFHTVKNPVCRALDLIAVADGNTLFAQEILKSVVIADKIRNKAVILNSDNLSFFNSYCAAVFGAVSRKVKLIVGVKLKARLPDDIIRVFCFGGYAYRFFSVRNGNLGNIV